MKVISYCLLFLIMLFGLIPAHAQDLYSSIAVGTIPDGSGRLGCNVAMNYGTLQSANDAALNACNRAGLINSRIAIGVRNAVGVILFFGNGGYTTSWGSNIIDPVEAAKQSAVNNYGGQPGAAATADWVIAGTTADQEGHFFGSASVVLPNRGNRGSLPPAGGWKPCQDRDPNAPYFNINCGLESTGQPIEPSH